MSGSTVPAGSTEQWHDKKRYLWLIGLVVPEPGLRRRTAAGWLTGLGALVLGRPGRDPRRSCPRSTWSPGSTARTRPTT